MNEYARKKIKEKSSTFTSYRISRDPAHRLQYIRANWAVKKAKIDYEKTIAK